MIRILTTTLVLSLFALTSFAQQKVILQSNGETSVFSDVDGFVDAYNAAVDGDTIYLPGLQYNSPASIGKRIVVYGTGYHPAHTEIMGQTVLSGLSIISGASGSHFEGLYVNGNIIFAAAKIDDIVIKRCYIDGVFSLNGTTTELSDNIRISENMINGRFSGSNTSNLIFNNNIIKSYTNSLISDIGNNAWVHNNVIIGRGFYQNYIRSMIVNISDSQIENNIIYNTGSSGYIYAFSNVSNNTFNNNIFEFDPTADLTNQWNNNYVDIDISLIFQNYTGDIFSFDDDLNLINPADYIGTTVNQVGIYGGLNPFKENTRPSNPQIITKNIQNSTDVDGNLGVEIEVEAQDE